MSGMRAAVVGLAVTAFLLGGLATGSSAEEAPLTQQQIEQALSGNTAIATGSVAYRQYFDPGGATVYVPEGGQPSRGKWRASADNTYCSWWAGVGWDCYALTGEGDRITWHARDGSTWPVRIVEGQQLEP